MEVPAQEAPGSPAGARNLCYAIAERTGETGAYVADVRLARLMPELMTLPRRLSDGKRIAPR